MRISEQWLRDWVDVAADFDEIAERLTMAGLEVDAIEPAAPALDGVVVARVATCEPHPDADRLSVCQVDLGDRMETIVCGAPNVAPGVCAPAATVGTRLPGGLDVQRAKLRGVASAGMLCSAAELGLGGDSDGLWLLPDDAPVGCPLAEYLALPDRILDIDLTPNRGDCLSMRGVAREVAVAFDRPFADAVSAPIATVVDARPAIRVSAPDLCSAYAGRIVEALAVNAATPMWLRERLRRAGVRPINLPVDIGNYVMLELGQPMHAFDADKLVGGIDVRRARDGERIVTLDGQDVTLHADTLVIADDAGPVAIAGMIGGQRTAVDAHTSRVLFESACFTPAAVAGQGRQYKIHTDSLHRFERGVDPALQETALDRATALLSELGGARPGPSIRAEGEPVFAADRRINLSADRIAQLLGQAIPGDTVVRALAGLGAQCEEILPGHWQVSPPSWRYDLAIEADLIEEVARLYGYDRLHAATPGVVLPEAAPERAAGMQATAAEVLRQRGYHEAITYSFVDPDLHGALTGDAAALTLDNPISDQMTVMRRTLWAGLLEAWAYNTRRQQSRIRLFEQGLRFVPDTASEHGMAQVDTLAALLSGNAHPMHWDTPARAVDFFDARGDIEALFGARAGRLSFAAATHPALHPGRAARVLLSDRPIGWVGQLAPGFARRYKGHELPYLFEVDRAALDSSETVRYEPPSDQPRVARDLALVVPERVTVGALFAVIDRFRGDVLQSADVFDVFRGQGLDAGEKSVALNLIFQDRASTLEDRDVDARVAEITDALRTTCGARLRGE